jgi:TRAP-type C4-dicarboxylate transport system permease small subunit
MCIKDLPMKKKITPWLILKNLDAIITGSTLVACVIIVNINVIMRYVFKSPLRWSEEVVTSLFVWTVFIGSAYAYRKHAHLGVDIVVNLMHGKTKRTVQLIMAFVELAILIMLTIISAQYVYNLLFTRGNFKPTVTDVLRIPKAYTGIAVPLGFLESTCWSVYFLLTEQLHIIKKKPSQDDGEYQVEGGNF